MNDNVNIYSLPNTYLLICTLGSIVKHSEGQMVA